MSVSPTHPMLRLVSTRVAPTQHPSPIGIPPAAGQLRRSSEDPRDILPNPHFLSANRIARENAAAADLSLTDARWVFAQETAQRLEGDKQAILRPQRRRDLHALATKAGLRPFDANLVIAIVQDAARNESGPLSTGAASRLGLVRPPATDSPSVIAQMLIASLLGILGTAILIAWFVKAL
ncbi:MAG: hypothetical protein H7210_11180 [Pyrinomonadaceae bacterium]|nr:hypothetical protein [Phycisphaerales bacterium]